MTNQKINFKAWNTQTGEQDLDGILDLKNESSWTDETVAEAVREFLDVYTIGYNPKEGELNARGTNSESRQVFIWPPCRSGEIHFAEDENTPETEYESGAQMKKFTFNYVNYTIVMKMNQDIER